MGAATYRDEITIFGKHICVDNYHDITVILRIETSVFQQAIVLASA